MCTQNWTDPLVSSAAERSECIKHADSRGVKGQRNLENIFNIHFRGTAEWMQACWKCGSKKIKYNGKYSLQPEHHSIIQADISSRKQSRDIFKTLCGRSFGFRSAYINVYIAWLLFRTLKMSNFLFVACLSGEKESIMKSAFHRNISIACTNPFSNNIWFS